MEILEQFAKIILQKNEFTGLCIFGNPYKLGFGGKRGKKLKIN